MITGSYKHNQIQGVNEVVYRRYPYVPRRRSETVLVKTPEVVAKFPLPNEKDTDATDRSFAVTAPGKTSFLETIFKRIGMEEIILIGLIFLLIEEGIQDELLLIILFYILISGWD